MSGGGTNTVSTSLPTQLLPYYNTALTQGQTLLGTGGPQYYSGQQVAPLTPMQTQGLQSIQDTAGGVNPSQSAANANAFETSGALLNPNANPYLQGMYTQAAQSADNQLQSQFGQAGSNVINSLPVVSDENNNLATQMYGGAYQQGLQQMTQASALAPSIQQGTYLPGQELVQAGTGQQQQQQNEINAAMQQYNWNSQLPYNMLSWYSGLLGQNASPFSSQTSQMNNNSAMTDIGAGVAGVGLMSELAPLFEGVGTAAAGA